MQIIQFLKDNIAWIRDIFTIILTIMATIISYETYKKAKKTLLQPIKSEVIHIQTELFIEILEYVNNLDYKLCQMYEEIIYINLYTLMKEYGFSSIEKDNQEFESYLSENDNGLIIFKGNIEEIDGLDICEKIFIEDIEGNNTLDVKKTNTDKKEAKVQCIKITKNYMEMLEKINIYINSPLLPTDIINLLRMIEESIADNISKTMRNILQDMIKELISNDKIISVEPRAIYNLFISKKIDCTELINKLRISIRLYLRVDEKW